VLYCAEQSNFAEEISNIYMTEFLVTGNSTEEKE
jgi:hypothetical protein